MFANLEDFQKAGKDNFETAVKNFGVVTKGLQAIAVEQTEYSKKAFEEGAAQLEKFAGVKSVEAAVELHSDYVKSSYEGAIEQATKISEMYMDLTKEAFKPFEDMVAKASK